MDIKDESRRRIIAMTYLLDESVLNITKDLERNGMLKDTVIVFSSDVWESLSNRKKVDC
jgi:arylsulfatase A-like enzyme